MTIPDDIDGRGVIRSTRDDIQRTHRDPALRWIMGVLTALIVLGVAGTSASVLSARATQTASRADVLRANVLAQQLRDSQVRNNDTAIQYRNYLSAQLTDLCKKINDIADQAGLSSTDCVVPPPPEPTSSPSPSTS